MSPTCASFDAGAFMRGCFFLSSIEGCRAWVSCVLTHPGRCDQLTHVDRRLDEYNAVLTEFLPAIIRYGINSTASVVATHIGLIRTSESTLRPAGRRSVRLVFRQSVIPHPKYVILSV